MRAILFISALALALASGAATAGDKDRPSGSTAQFETLDRNSDQRLSQSEASSDENVATHFAALDVDGNGYVTKREYTARMQKDQRDPSTASPQRRPMPEDTRKPY